ncbi:MAG: chemotaxis protein CheW [Chamaesiphon sp.]
MAEQRQFCTFFLNGMYFGIEVQDVQEVIRYHQLTRVPLAPSDICGLINLRGQIVTAIDLGRRLQLSESPSHSFSDEELPFNVVVRTDSEVVSLLVDEIGDILEVTEDNFEPPPVTLKGRVRQLLQGAYKLKDGFLLVLDTKKLLEIRTTK